MNEREYNALMTDRNTKVVSVIFVLLIIATIIMYFLFCSSMAQKEKIKKLEKVEEVINDTVIIDDENIKLSVSNYKKSAYVNARFLDIEYEDKKKQGLDVKVKVTSVNDKTVYSSTYKFEKRNGEKYESTIELRNSDIENLGIKKVNKITFSIIVENKIGTTLSVTDYELLASNADANTTRGRQIFNQNNLKVFLNKIYEENGTVNIRYTITNYDKQKITLLQFLSVNNIVYNDIVESSHFFSPNDVRTFDVKIPNVSSENDINSLILKLYNNKQMRIEQNIPEDTIDIVIK